MTIDLAAIKTEVSALLVDSAYADIDEDALEGAIQQTLRRMNLVVSYRRIGAITLSRNSRELDISSLTQPAVVDRVWCPYIASAPQDGYSEPYWRSFEEWTNTTLFITDGDCPETGDVARLLYHTPHTLDDLDAASDTTLDASLIGILVTGAAGWVLLSRWRHIAETLKSDPNAVRLIADLRDRYNAEFVNWFDLQRARPCGGFEPIET